MNKFNLYRVLKYPPFLAYVLRSTGLYKAYSKWRVKDSFSDNDDFSKTEITQYNRARKYGSHKTICFAADSNLYFDMYGNVSLCCYNRKHILGNIRENSIDDIWNGQKIREARTEFAGSKLVSGCSMCYLNLKKGEYESAMALNYDSFGISSSDYPTRMEFELSNICNLECIMCSGDFSNLIRKNREDRPPIAMVYKEKFLEDLKDYLPHIQFANFLGGEPQMIRIYYDIWENLVALGRCIIRVQTNAATLHDRFLRLISTSGQFQISVSVDSMEPDTLERIRTNIDHRQFLNNLQTLIELHKKSKIDLGITICPIVPNSRELSQIVLFATRNKIKASLNQVIQPYYLSLASLPVSQLDLIIHDCQECLGQIDSTAYMQEIINFNKRQLESFIFQLENWKTRSIENAATYQKGMALTEEEVKRSYFKSLDEIIKNLGASDIKPTKIRDMILKKTEGASEHVKKDIFLRLMEIPVEYDNTDFQGQRESGYMPVVEQFVSYLLKNEPTTQNDRPISR
ncbi:MAG: radical SAM protein [Bacteroidetes bacterium]|nr:radical SAM protein [Bacteroidota bacterium]